ncbi:MAG TPA: hypothetical protein VLN48_20445 [Bryobacteraceae bacterium]|nr:hypothetical protein [Bryobacteraceae bacterium]
MRRCGPHFVYLPGRERFDDLEKQGRLRKRVYQQVHVVAHHNPGMQIVVPQVPFRVSDGIGDDAGDFGAHQAVLVLNAAMQSPSDE